MRLQAGDAADEAARILGNVLDVARDGVIGHQTPDRAVALLDARGHGLHVLHRLVEVLDGRLQLVERAARTLAGLRDLLVRRPHQRLDRFGDLTDVLDRLLEVVRLRGGHALDVRGDVIDAVEQPLEDLRVGGDQFVDLVGDVADRPGRQPAHVDQDLAHHRYQRADVGHDLTDANRLDDVLQLVAVDQLAHRLGAAVDLLLRRTGIDLQVVLAQQRRRLL